MNRIQNSKWVTLGVEKGWIGTTELEMLRFMEKEFGQLSNQEVICSIFVNLFLSAGHVCLPLNLSPGRWGEILELDQESISMLDEEALDLPDPSKSKLIGKPDDEKPLIIDGQNLSFRRYWAYEKKLMDWVQSKSDQTPAAPDPQIVKEELNNLFPDSSSEIDWQKTAVTLSLLKPFLIISGGPGTGKTTTVARMLALHQRLNGGQLNIALAAPTGKAAGRMGEALRNEFARMNLSESQMNQFPKEAKTVHRLLSGTEEKGLLPPGEIRKLNYDLIIVDEASMLDLSLMIRLITHLPEKTRLILLGDRDQLASVEAGSIFADLCQKPANGFRTTLVHKLNEFGLEDNFPVVNGSTITDTIVYLEKSYRFDTDSGVGRLSEAIKQQISEPDAILNIFENFDDLSYSEFNYSKNEMQTLGEDFLSRVIQAAIQTDPEELLNYWKSTMWLVVLRRGLEGAEYLNRFVEQFIASSRRIKMQEGWYHGRMIMITQNDYNLGVFNGDLGVCVKSSNGTYQVYIESGSVLKRVHPAQLMHFVPAYFLTVHKSQGSEFDHVNLLLPSKDTRVLSKELIYTAVTRAKKRFSVFGDLNLLASTVNRPIERFSGLMNEEHQISNN